MTAIRDITNLFTKRLCRIVFVKDRQAATSLTETITAQHPEYICAASEQFNDYKQFGPFKLKSKDHLWEMIGKTETFREMRKATDLHSAYAMMEAELAAIDCLPLQYRSPRGMSAMQKLRSSILCDILNGNFHFVLNDCAFDDPSDSAETRSYRKKRISHHRTVHKAVCIL